MGLKSARCRVDLIHLAPGLKSTLPGVDFNSAAGLSTCGPVRIWVRIRRFFLCERSDLYHQMHLTDRNRTAPQDLFLAGPVHGIDLRPCRPLRAVSEAVNRASSGLRLVWSEIAVCLVRSRSWGEVRPDWGRTGAGLGPDWGRTGAGLGPDWGRIGAGLEPD
jgi:hypothetical protein